MSGQDARLTEESESVIVWRGVPEVRCSADVLAEIGELAMSGYRRYPWGGVEIGGVLFGKRESETIYISCFREAACEHQQGPAFDLSERDCEAFKLLLASATGGEEELAGLAPVGWYQSVSRRDGGLSQHARALFYRFFPEPWQIAMVVKRSKQDPLSIGIFVRDAHGRIERHSPMQDFALDMLRQPPPPATALESPARTPEPADSRHDAPRADLKRLAAALTPPDPPFPFFGLTADPFSAQLNAQCFYPSPQHREALAVLLHRIRSRAGFLALLGAPGTGKSIVLECLRDLLTAHATHFAFLLNSKIGVAEFFELIAHDFQLPCPAATKTATLIALNEYLLERSRSGQTTALVIDNAEKLSTEVLEEIELLGNLENREGRLLQVVFAAQPDFERQLDAPELCALKQRLLLRARLEPLDSAETAAYIEHRMATAGGRNQSVFPDGVLAGIHRRTHGVPRLINALCSRLLSRCRELQVQATDIGMLECIADDLVLDAHGEG